MDHNNFPHFSAEQWSVVMRMFNVLGQTAMEVILQLEPSVQVLTVNTFSMGESKMIAEAENHAKALAENAVYMRGSEVRRVPLKLKVTSYSGRENENVLRWFLEVETSMYVAQVEPEFRVAYAMSYLDGRAKDWAFNKRLVDSDCFPEWETFKNEMLNVFQPPKSEFRARTKFLSLKQGSKDLHAFVQEVRYLSASIVQQPIDEATKVSVFMSGLNGGPIRTQLFRQYPETLEEAISLAMEEDFSIQQAKGREAQAVSREKKNPGTPMDLSVVNTAVRHSNSNVICFRCGQKGHMANKCYANIHGKGNHQPAQRRGGMRKSQPRHGVRLNSNSAAGRSPGNGGDQ